MSATAAGTPHRGPSLEQPRPAPADWIWVAAAALVVLLGARIWATPGGRAMLRLPSTPAEQVNPALASQWLLLRSCARLIPDDATYTVRAADPGDEMTLYMISFGLLGHARPIPSSYYGRALPEVGARASYVVVLGDEPLNEPGAELVTRLDGGSLWRRSHPAAR